MTSGQGGPPEGGRPGPSSGGQPGGSSGPPPGPPSGPPYPGYVPAPAASFGDYRGPTPQERPLTVRAGLGGFVGSLVLSVISTLVTLLNWGTISARLVAALKAQPGANAEAVQAAARLGLKVGVVLALAFAAVYALFVWFAWRGRNWARVVLWVLGGLGIVFGLGGLAAGGQPIPFLTGLSFFQVGLLILGVVALALRPSHEWFRYQGWLRTTGRAR